MIDQLHQEDMIVYSRLVVMNSYRIPLLLIITIVPMTTFLSPLQRYLVQQLLLLQLVFLSILLLIPTPFHHRQFLIQMICTEECRAQGTYHLDVRQTTIEGKLVIGFFSSKDAFVWSSSVLSSFEASVALSNREFGVSLGFS